MSKEKYINDIKEIRHLMQKSSKFLSLSGLSGIMAGIYALLGSYWAYSLLKDKRVYIRSYDMDNVLLIYKLLAIAIGVAVLAVITAYILSRKKASKSGDKLWTPVTRAMLVDFIIPMFSGGIFALILLYHDHFGIIAPITLIFYGLALVSVSKYTIGSVKYLGVSEIILGLLAAFYVGYGLWFWAFGFGILHIVYGMIMYLKERK